MLSAQQIYLTAPLGSLVRYASGEPRPPVRFTRKVQAWENENGAGRLVERKPEDCGVRTRHPATFTLHVGNFGSNGTIILSMSRSFHAESAKSFEILETPKPGTVRILTGSEGHDVLRFLAADMEEAERWMAEHHFSSMRAEIVGDPDPVPLPEPRQRAA